MSGIISLIKNHKKKSLFCALLFILAALIGIYIYIYNIIACIIACAVTFLILIFFLLNLMTIRKVNSQKTPFNPRSAIRNVDYLIIGDMCDPNQLIPSGKTYVQLSAPDRNLMSAYEILRHTYSILDEKYGTVVFVIKDKYINVERFSIFDIPLFHKITINRLNLKMMIIKANFPFLFSPLKSIKLLLGIKISGWKNCECPKKKINQFCEERSIKLIYYYK